MSIIELLERFRGTPALRELETALSQEESERRSLEHNEAAEELATLDACRPSAIGPYEVRVTELTTRYAELQTALQRLAGELLVARQDLACAKHNHDRRRDSLVGRLEATAGPSVDAFIAKWRTRIDAATDTLYAVRVQEKRGGTIYAEDRAAARAVAEQREAFRSARAAVAEAVAEARGFKLLPDAQAAERLAALDERLAGTVKRLMGVDAHLILDSGSLICSTSSKA